MDIRNVAQTVDTDVLKSLSTMKTFFPDTKLDATYLETAIPDVTYRMVTASLNRLQQQGKVAFDGKYDNIRLA